MTGYGCMWKQVMSNDMDHFVSLGPYPLRSVISPGSTLRTICGFRHWNGVGHMQNKCLTSYTIFLAHSEHFMKRLKNHLENLGSLTLFPQNPSIIPPSITRPIYFCTVESITLKNISYISHHSLASVTSDYFQEKIRVPNKANKH